MAKRPSGSSGLLLAGAIAAGLTVIVCPALAQFGQSGPPRPPANVPGRGPAPAPAPLGLPEQMPPEEMDDDAQPPPPPTRPPAGAARSQPGIAVAPPASTTPGAVRSQPLAPPPGAAVAPSGPPAQAAVPPPGQYPQPPRAGQPAPNGQQQDETVTEMPSQKIANPVAVFAGLDKITGRIIAFDVKIDEKVQFGALQVTPRVCYTRPPTETANTDSFVEVEEVTLQGEVKRLFSGWMFAASPGINAVEHPIYDVWLTDCKGGGTVVSDAQPNAPAAPPPSQRAPQPRTGAAAAGTPRPPAPRPQAQPQRQDMPPVPPPFQR